MALSINIDGNSYELTGVDHPAEEDTVRKLIQTIEKYAKDDKDLQNKLLKEFKDQLGSLNSTAEDIKKEQSKTTRTTATSAPATSPQAAAATNKAFNSAANAAGNSSRVLGSLTTNAGFASNAIQSMNSGLQETSGSVSKLAMVVPVVGKVLGGLAAAAGFAVTSIISLGTAALGAFQEAAKYQGDLAKQGVVFTDSLQGLNYAAGQAGMTMEQLSSVMKANSAAITALGRAGQSGAARFAALITAARGSSESLKGLGFSAQEEAQARADYVDILREQGSADQLRMMTDSQIITQSTKMVKGFMGVAAVTGKTVDELMKKTKELAGSTDVRLTLDALNLSSAQREKIAKNFAVLDSMGMGGLKDVYLEMQTFGTGIGELGIELKTMGIGPQVENFLKGLDKMDPAQMQIEIIKFAKTLPTQQVADFTAKAQMLGGPGAAIAAAMSKAAAMTEAEVKAAHKKAEEDKKAVAAAQSFNDAMNKLKSAFTGVLLAIAESEGFQKALLTLIKFIDTHAITISQRLGAIGAALFNFLGMLLDPTGRQQIINDFRSLFTEVLIGIKKETLGRLNLYSAEEEARDRKLLDAKNDAAMAQTRALSRDAELAKLEGDLTNKRLLYYTEMDADKRKILDQEIESLKGQIDKRKGVVLAGDEAAKSTAAQAQAAQEAADKNRAGFGTLALGIIAGAGILALAWGTVKNLIIKGVERYVLGGMSKTMPSLPGSAAPTVPPGAKQDKDGRWRDSQGRYTKGPTAPTVPGAPTAPTTLKGIGMGALSDLSKGLTGALTWVAKGAAIAGSMYLIGKALPALAEGMQKFNDVEWESMGKAGSVLTVVTGGLVAMSKVPLKALGSGLLVFAGVAGAMYALGMGLSKLVEPLKAFESISWETLGKGGVVLAAITAAIFGLGAIISSGAGAVLFGAGILGFLGLAAAIGALGVAMQQLPMPQLELFAKVFTDVVNSVSDVVKNIFSTIPDIINAIGTSIATVVTSITDGIGKIIDKIAAYKTAGVEATTAQIERLSAIPSEKIQSTATAVASLKQALDGFGGGFFENLGRSFSSLFGADQASQLERTADAMERYKKSVSVLKEMGGGEFVLKPVDVGLYEQLQETLNQTKGQINTTFSKKTYEETFKGTTKAIDGTYNHVTSKLIETLTNTKNAIRDTFKPPVEALKELSETIVGYVKLATRNIGTPPGGGKIETQKDWLAAVMQYFGGSNKEVTGTKAELQQYIKDISPKEGKDESVNPDTYAMGRIQLMPATLVGLAKARGDKRFASAPTETEAQKKQLTQQWMKLSAAEKNSYYEQYALSTYNELKKKLGRNPTQAEWHAAQFGVKDVASAILNPEAPLSASQVRAIGSNQRVFDEYAGGAGSSPSTPKRPGTPLDVSPAALAGGTIATGAGFRQLVRNKDGVLVDATTRKNTEDGTLTAVSSEEDTQGKILNILEQTFNLHATKYGSDRFKGFTAFTQG